MDTISPIHSRGHNISLKSKKPKIAFILGARPNYIKVASLWRAASTREDFDLCLVNTGQHYDPDLSEVFLQQLAMPQPDHSLGVGSGTHADQTARVMTAFEKVAISDMPDLVVVVGDVNSTFACALVAVKLGIKVAHVEAGLRSFDRTMPEEINRLLTDAISDYLFATEPVAVENLQREGILQEKIFLVGNVMIDTLKQSLPVAEQSSIYTRLGLRQNANGLKHYALMTLHRPSNVDNSECLERLVSVIERISKLIPVVFPIHPRTRSRLSEARLLGRLEGLLPHVILTPPIGYVDFLALMKSAHLVLTDSGGIQEETTALSVPCLTLRENTERWITVTQGTNQIVGTNPEAILLSVARVLRGDWIKGRVPDLWDGEASRRIISILGEKLGTSPVG